MKIAIFDPHVRHNVLLFKHLVQRAAEKRKRFVQLANKTYVTFVNRHTGDFRFLDLEKESLSQKEWRQLIIELHPEKGEGAFDIVVPDNPYCFDCNDLDKPAYLVLSRTMCILNEICYDPRRGDNPLWVLGQINQLEVEISDEEEGESQCLEKAFFPIFRIQAEKRLFNVPVGTYLFRKDEYAMLLEEGLNQNFNVPIRCFTLTYHYWDGIIVEKTVIEKDTRWLFYEDDPTLSNHCHPTLKKLLNSLNEDLTRPLTQYGE